MKKLFKAHRKLSIAIVVILVVTTIFVVYKRQNSASVLGLYDDLVAPIHRDVQIEADVKGCEVDLEVIPEKRVPPTGNWSTNVNVQVFDTSNNYLGEFNAVTNGYGYVHVNICEVAGIDLPPGTYRFYARGRSHLRKRFEDKATFATASSELDLSENKVIPLLAGETSVIYDNYINALDLSTQIAALETGNITNDLNQDGEVNVLDLSATLVNMFVYGDCSPKDEADGYCDFNQE